MKMTMEQYFQVIEEAMQLCGMEHDWEGYWLESDDDFGNYLLEVLAPKGYEYVIGWLLYYRMMYDELHDWAYARWGDREEQSAYLFTAAMSRWIFHHHRWHPRRSSSFYWEWPNAFLGYNWDGIMTSDTDNPQLVEHARVINLPGACGARWQMIPTSSSYFEFVNDLGFDAWDVIELDMYFTPNEAPAGMYLYFKVSELIDVDDYLRYYHLLKERVAHKIQAMTE
jgi:hypothetical protein